MIISAHKSNYLAPLPLRNPLKLTRMRQAARATFEQTFSANANHKMLMAIYERAMSGCSSASATKSIREAMHYH